MIETVVKAGLPVDETLKIQKKRIMSEAYSGKKRISIVTGIHGDELEGQYVAFLLGRRLKEHPEFLRCTVDVYPAMNPLGINTIQRGVPLFDLDMNRIFPGADDGPAVEYFAHEAVEDMRGADIAIDIHASNIFLRKLGSVLM